MIISVLTRFYLFLSCIIVVTFDHENSVNNYETKVTFYSTNYYLLFYPLYFLPPSSPSLCPLYLSHSCFFYFYPPNRRRTGTGGLPLKTIIPDVLIRDKLVTGQFSPIILYEDGGYSSDGSVTSGGSGDSVALFVAKCIQEELGIQAIHILDGNSPITHLLFSHNFFRSESFLFFLRETNAIRFRTTKFGNFSLP